MISEVCWDGLWTLSFGLSQFHGHGSWLVCEVALIIKAQIIIIILNTCRSRRHLKGIIPRESKHLASTSLIPRSGSLASSFLSFVAFFLINLLDFRSCCLLACLRLLCTISTPSLRHLLLPTSAWTHTRARALSLENHNHHSSYLLPHYY
jgi:hypothetical protein